MDFPVEFSFTGHGTIRLLSHVDLRCLEWHGGLDLRSFYDHLWESHASGLCTVLVADISGYAAGQIVIHWAGKPAHLDFPDQQSLRVHPAFRGLGLGTRLIEASESYVRTKGFARVGLSVGVHNHGAKRLYQRLGYEAITGPYEDRWSYTDALGRSVLVTETVFDMVKILAA